MFSSAEYTNMIEKTNMDIQEQEKELKVLQLIVFYNIITKYCEILENIKLIRGNELYRLSQPWKLITITKENIFLI